MNEKTPDALVKGYLREVNRAVAPLPAAQRKELLDEISEHISESRLERQTETDASVREILERLGTPASIARAAALEGSPTRTRERSGFGRENLALVLLLFGGWLFGLGWFVGVYLLWESPAWTRSEKALGTLVLPGGFAGVIFGFPFISMTSGLSIPDGILLLIMVLLPLITCAVLVARRRPSVAVLAYA